MIPVSLMILLFFMENTLNVPLSFLQEIRKINLYALNTLTIALHACNDWYFWQLWLIIIHLAIATMIVMQCRLGIAYN